MRALRYRGRGLICLGLLEILEGNRDKGMNLIERGRTVNGSPLFSRILTLLEAYLLEAPASLTKEFASDLRAVAGKERLPVRADVLRLGEWMHTFQGMEWNELGRCVRTIKGYLSRAASLEWSRKEGLLLCRALHRGGFLVALERVAGPLKKKWPDQLEIEAYELIARTRNNGRRLRPGDGMRMRELTDALEGGGNHLLADSLHKGYRLACDQGLERPEIHGGIFGLPVDYESEIFEDLDDDDDDESLPTQLDLF